MNIKTRLTLMGAGIILTTVGILTAGGVWQGSLLHVKARQIVDQLAAVDLDRAVQSTYALVQSQDQSLTTQVAHDQSMADYLVRQEGGLHLSESRLTWEATNQFTHQHRRVYLPQMCVGTRWLGRNGDPGRGTPLVDEITALTGASATIFERMDAEGDLLRVATTVRALGGRRAVGTYIPAVNPDGTPNAVVACLLSGRTYRGNAFVVNAWYVSEYSPLRDGTGRVIGAFYTGVKQEQVSALRAAILSTHVGHTGSVAILSGAGPSQGAYRIAPLGTPDGRSLWGARDARGWPYVRTLIDRALTLGPGQSFSVRYLAPAAPGAAPAWHLARVAYYRPWDWVIVADCPAADYRAIGDRLSVDWGTVSHLFILLGLVLAGAGGWFFGRVAHGISRSVGEVAAAAAHLADRALPDFCRDIQALGAGRLDAVHSLIRIDPLPFHSRDEIGAMAASFNAMQGQIAAAAEGLEDARARLRQAHEDLLAANTALEENVVERTAALHETEQRTRLAVEAAHLGTWDLDLATGYRHNSSSTLRMFGGTETSPSVGSVWPDCLHPDDRPRVMAALDACRAGEALYAVEYRVVWPDSSVHWIASQARVYGDGGGQRLIGVCRDITHEKELEAEREHLLAEALERADHCPLTGLLNHRAFHKRLAWEAERAQREGTTLGVVIVDVDNFTFFNDVYGHLAGDEVLCLVTESLRRLCGPKDTLARYGGDEFALLLPGASTGAHLWERLQADLDAGGYRPPGQPETVPVRASLGVAIYPQEADTRIEALEMAERRLRRAKAGEDGDGLVERLHAQLSHTVEGFTMLDALVTSVDNKDRYTRRHSEDVMTYSLLIARELGLDGAARHTIAVAALLHDVGKIGVPDHILRKPGRLTDDEFEAIKMHPMMGSVIVGAVPGFEGTLDAVRHHHERWDGGGYPFGLRGEETPLSARLMAVADAFSAMTTDRPYRKGMERGRALSILREGAGTQWDPACVQAFLACWPEEAGLADLARRSREAAPEHWAA